MNAKTLSPRVLIYFVQRGRFAGYWRRVPMQWLAEDLHAGLRKRGHIVRFVL